jgi:hypothetical protein
MAVRAVTGELAVVTLDGESGLSGVIEVRRVDGSQVSVASLVLGVAHGAVLNGSIAMDSLFCGHSFGDQIMANETSFSIDVEVIVVAVLAAVWILEAFMSEAEAAGHVVDLVILCERRHRARDQNGRQNEYQKTTPKKRHPTLIGIRFTSSKTGHRYWRLNLYGITEPPRVRGGAKIFGSPIRQFQFSQCVPSFTTSDQVILNFTHE